MKKTIQQTTLIHSRKFLSFLSLFFFSGFILAQTAQIIGKIVDENGKPLDKAEIVIENNIHYTDENGNFKIDIPSNKSLAIIFNYENYSSYSQILKLKNNRKKQLFVQLVPESDKSINLNETVITFQANNKSLQSTTLSARQMQEGPNLTGGVTDLLKTLPFVNSNTELSSQYMVRGGNYDENLIYVNGLEIYKPQLIRSGEQEGLGFVNPNMVDFINFSAGGWESKYGDKMSSVLDVIYKRPKKIEGQFEASLMGGSLTIGNASKNKKLSAITGFRYQNRNLVLNTLKGNTNFNPQYYDLQTNINYKLNDKWNIAFLGAISHSRYEMFPIKRDTYINTLENPLLLTVFYYGKEDDRYNTKSGNLSVTYTPNSKVNLDINFFATHFKEQEYFDIQGSYFISNTDEKGNATTTNDVTSQINHARNNFDALIIGVHHRGKYKINGNNNIEWGTKIQQEDIRDLLNEWQVIDSSGYIVNTTPHNGLNLDYFVESKNNIKSNRISGYVQYTGKYLWDETKLFFDAGIRTTYWDFNNQTNVSPRMQIAIKPNWEKDILFRFSTGIYYQPPFYREIRRLDGSLNNSVKSQKSIHFILGNDYEFKWMDRPFKLTTEVYYKILQDLNPYYVDNVRIRYTAENNSKGHSFGLDMRLYGQFVEGLDSWFSLSYARAYQNIDNRGNIPLPTDPRFKISAFFQDYMNFLPSFKVNVNMIYASGLPNGAPQFYDPYNYQTTLSDYKRVDIGLVKEFKTTGGLWKNFKEISIGIDIFNIFNIKNQISNSWIRDSNTPTVYAMPNYLTGRFFNGKINFKF